MNKEVNFKIAKLLKEKGFDEPCRASIVSMSEPFYGRGLKTNSELIKEGLPTLCSAPTIAEVVMWLYEKHGIWIVAIPLLVNGETITWYPSTYEQGIGEDIEVYFKTPTEAYEAGIKYALENLL